MTTVYKKPIYSHKFKLKRKCKNKKKKRKYFESKFESKYLFFLIIKYYSGSSIDPHVLQSPSDTLAKISIAAIASITSLIKNSK